MAQPLRVSHSRTYPIPAADAFSLTLPLPLDQLFSKRYGPIPPIKRTTQDGVWGTVGQVRTVHTADGGSMREQLLTVESSRQFTYKLSDVSGPMKPLVARVDGAWTFAEVGTGCRVTWSWTVYPAGAAGKAAMPAFARLWKGYARGALDRLEGLLLVEWKST